MSLDELMVQTAPGHQLLEVDHESRSCCIDAQPSRITCANLLKLVPEIALLQMGVWLGPKDRF